MVSSTRTRYAKCGDADIAYQVLGEGPIDLLLYTGGTIPIDCMDEQPSIVRFQRRLASFSRIIRFDVRGVGLSDRASPTSPPTGEELVADAIAVLDAVGSERAAVFAPGISSVAGLTLAALHPERLSSLIVLNGFARTAWAPDYPHGAPPSAADTGRLAAEPDAVEKGFDLLALAAPSVAGDPAFRAWFDRVGNLGATPTMARLIMQAMFEADVRDLLARIRVPTLVMHRRDIKRPFGPGHGRYLGEHIAGAKYVELSGVDLFYWVGESREMLDEIEEFLTGIRGAASERVLATVLFTDIVGSTGRAAQLGDGRWRELLDRHDEIVRTQLQRFRGREVKSMGDGFVATFDSPARAIECALAIRQTLATFDVGVRAGIHTGEIEVRGEDVAGLAVHLGARVSALAEPGEVLVSSTVKDLVVGSHVEFTERGEHELKGVPGTWRLYAVDG